MSKKIFNLGDMTVIIEVKETTPFGFNPTRCLGGVRRVPRFGCPPPPVGEPDGFDAHIDNPKPWNPRYRGFDGQWLFNRDKQRYHEALDAVKRCDWECREPIGAVNAPNAPRFRAPMPAPAPCFCAPIPEPRFCAPIPEPRVGRVWIDDDWDDDDFWG